MERFSLQENSHEFPPAILEFPSLSKFPDFPNKVTTLYKAASRQVARNAKFLLDTF